MTNEQMLQLRQFSIQAALTLPPVVDMDRIDFAEQVYTFVTQDVKAADEANKAQKQAAIDPTRWAGGAA